MRLCKDRNTAWRIFVLVFVMIFFTACSKKDLENQKCHNNKKTLEENGITEIVVGNQKIKLTQSQEQVYCRGSLGLDEKQVKQFLKAMEGEYVIEKYKILDEISDDGQKEVMRYINKLKENSIKISSKGIEYKGGVFSQVYILYNPNFDNTGEYISPTQIFTNSYKDNLRLYIGVEGYDDTFYMYDLVNLKNNYYNSATVILTYKKL